MEGVAAFSLACNILQIVETSRALVKSVKEIRASMNGRTSEHKNLRKSAKQMLDVAVCQQEKEKDPKLQETAGRW
jgi:Sec-independent protein translocase protein TatA